MILLSIALLCMCLLALSMASHWNIRTAVAAAPATSRMVRADRGPAAATRPTGPAPTPPLFEWATAEAPMATAIPDAPRPMGDAEGLRRKLRDRYIAARFPGVARTVADLERSDPVIKAARLYFEEDKCDRALELLDLAIEQSPREEAMALARLELVFLIRGAARFVALAHDFHRAHPQDARWPEICRLGRALDANEPLFRSGDGEAAAMPYGPWPDMPNWIQASWDLTSEVRAAEFHQAMARQVAAVRPSTTA